MHQFPNMGWLELIGMPSVDILHRSDCTNKIQNKQVEHSFDKKEKN